ncbi:hypothetical protein PG984_012789 [Apiospora sp. TS-2023a]
MVPGHAAHTAADMTVLFTEAVFASLAHKIDVIFHLGAARSFGDSYQTLQPVNVGRYPRDSDVGRGASRRVPIHFEEDAGARGGQQFESPKSTLLIGAFVKAIPAGQAQ